MRDIEVTFWESDDPAELRMDLWATLERYWVPVDVSVLYDDDAEKREERLFTQLEAVGVVPAPANSKYDTAAWNTLYAMGESIIQSSLYYTALLLKRDPLVYYTVKVEDAKRFWVEFAMLALYVSMFEAPRDVPVSFVAAAREELLRHVLSRLAHELPPTVAEMRDTRGGDFAQLRETWRDTVAMYPRRVDGNDSYASVCTTILADKLSAIIGTKSDDLRKRLFNAFQTKGEALLDSISPSTQWRVLCSVADVASFQ